MLSDIQQLKYHCTYLHIVKPEKVYNPYGSTAGAGSGEFHIYRHARAREAERWKNLNDAEREKALEEEYKQTLEDNQTEEERKTAQRRKKRQRQKEAKQKKKNLALAGVNLEQEKKTDDDDEFTYVPLAQQRISEEVEKKEDTKPAPEPNSEKEPPASPFANDGSFLEMMKKRLAEKTNGEEDGSDEGPPVKKQAIGD